ncbi:MAG: hypothetical protein AAFU64_19090, partial [Bacteroidota bacterium]
MKKNLAYFVFILLSFQACVFAQTDIINSKNWQEDIDQAFSKSFIVGSSDLSQIADKLEKSWKESQDRNFAYWAAYTYNWLTIYQMNQDQKEEGSTTVQKAISLLKGIKKKTSEDYALMASLTSLSISFDPGKATILGSKADNMINQAIKLNDKNLRAYLVRGRSDYYVPVKYGGGTKVESNLLKAISLKDKYSEDPMAPSWGRNQAYQVMVQYFMREERLSEAKVYCKRGLKLFPEDY